MPFDQKRNPVIERLLNYAEHHLNSFSAVDDAKKLRLGLDHFLLTINAVAENLKAVAVQWKDCSPVANDCKLVPAFAPIVWAWVASVHVAHRYVEFVKSDGTELSGAVGGHALGIGLYRSVGVTAAT